MVPGIYDETLADEILEVSTEEAHAMVKLLARVEGLLVGISAAAAVAVCLRVAQSLVEGYIVTVLPDAGTRYLNERFWEKESQGNI